MGGANFNNRPLFPLLFSGNFCVGDKALMEGYKVVLGGFPSPPLGNALANDTTF